MKKIVVTGGAGFIGSNTVRVLCDLGYKVKVIDDLSFGFRKFVDNRAEFFHGRIEDSDFLDKVLDDTDVVMHFAASSIIKTSIQNPLRYIENNITNGTKLLESMRRVGVRKIIFSSSASVYGQTKQTPIKEDSPKNPLQPYGASKLAFENILSAYYHSYGINSVSLRYFNAYGPNDEQLPLSRAVPMWIKEILNGENVKIYWGGNQLRDYVYVEDIAQAHVDVLDIEGCHAFNIGCGKGILMKDILKEIINITGSNPKIIDQGERVGDPTELVADITLINHTVGWKPKWNIHDGLVKTIEYFKSNT